jgi:hypothetical protein
METIEPSARLPLSSEQDIVVLVEEKIEEEIAKRLVLPEEDVQVEYLGLANTRRCANPDHVSIRIPQSEDFRGSVLVFVQAEKNGRTCGQWSLRTKMEIWEEVDVAAQHFSGWR